MSIMIKNLDMPIGCQKCKFFRKHMFGNGLDYSYSCILGAKEFPIAHLINQKQIEYETLKQTDNSSWSELDYTKGYLDALIYIKSLFGGEP